MPAWSGSSGSPPPGCRLPAAVTPSQGREGEPWSLHCLRRAPTPFMRVLPHDGCVSEGPPPNTITLEIRFHHINGGGAPHSV